MKNILQKLATLFNKLELLPARKARKTNGQSLVEFAIAFPVVIMLFAGVVEFGFILNYYLSLLDATREAARWYSNQDPFGEDPRKNDLTAPRNDPLWFYADTAVFVKDALEPRSVNDTTRKVVLDTSKDDIIITVFSLCGTKVVTFPNANGYHLFNNDTSAFTDPITGSSTMPSRPSGAPNQGILLVEVNYDYHQVLALPWITIAVPNPLPLRAYTIMPLAAAEPPLPHAPLTSPVVACP